ncbi:hypothetical protein GCM10023259_103680 [Thermocatellispora tengchongensis]
MVFVAALTPLLARPFAWVVSAVLWLLCLLKDGGGRIGQVLLGRLVGRHESFYNVDVTRRVTK